MVKRLVLLVLAASLIGTADAASLYEQAQAAYGRADNTGAFLQCVKVIEAAPASADAKKARYLMTVLWSDKLRPPECRQVLEQLRPARPWLAGFCDGVEAESQMDWNQAVSQTLEFIAIAPDEGWVNLAALRLCRQADKAQACGAEPAVLVQAAIRLRQSAFHDCPEVLRAFADRNIFRNNKPETARLRVEWRRLVRGEEDFDRIVAEYLMAGAPDEAKQFAEELIRKQPNEWQRYWQMATAFVNQGDAGFAFQLLRRGIESQPASARAGLLKYLPEQQEIICRDFCASKNQDKAQTLADLWREGFLKNEFKERLVQEHYQLVLRQISTSGGSSSWDVRCEQTFPFPDVWTEFTPTLYVNDEVKWAPGRSQTSRSMSVTGGNPITSMSGGKFKNGDVLQYKIDLRQKPKWQISLWTNKITLEGLQH
jgi:tetratricopeptide (TPR) repeat protein